MSGLMTSFNAGVSGLQSAYASLNNTAHNLANADTEGYVRQQVVVTDSFYRKTYGAYANLCDVGTGTIIAKTRQVRNTFLDSQYRLQVGRQEFYEMNMNAALEVEDMLGELHGEQFSTSIHNLWEALNSLAGDPGNIVLKDELVSMASQFLESAKVLQNDLTVYQTSLNQEVQLQVDTINSIADEVDNLNKLIRRYESADQPANDYRDKRNLLLDQLSGIIDFEVAEEVDGTVSIYTEGAFLVDSAGAHHLSTQYIDPNKDLSGDSGYTNPTFRLLKPVWANGDDFFPQDTLEYSTLKRTDVGSLKGLMTARGNYAANYSNIPNEANYYTTDPVTGDKVFNQGAYDKDLERYNETVGVSTIMTVQSQLDSLVHEIVTAVNDTLCPNLEVDQNLCIELPDIGINLTRSSNLTITATGEPFQWEDGMLILDESRALCGDDEDLTVGTELFSRENMDRYERVECTLAYFDGEGNPQTKEINLFIYNKEMTKAENPEDKMDLIYSQYTISQLEINPAVLKDSSKLPVSYNASLENLYGHGPNGESTKTDNVGGYANNELLALANSFSDDIGSLRPQSLTQYNVFEFYEAMVGDLGTQANVWGGIIDNQTTTVTTLYNERQNVMGVSTDEELSNLIKYQQCYNASSRYITTVSEMLEYLIERLGG